MLGVYSFYVSSKNFLFIMLTPAGDKKQLLWSHHWKWNVCQELFGWSSEYFLFYSNGRLELAIRIECFDVPQIVYKRVSACCYIFTTIVYFILMYVISDHFAQQQTTVYLQKKTFTTMSSYFLVVRPY